MPNQLSFERRKPATTKADILRAMRREHTNGANAITRREIAALVMRKVTPRLVSLIEELHADGQLQRGVMIWPNGAQGFVYAVLDNDHE